MWCFSRRLLSGWALALLSVLCVACREKESELARDTTTSRTILVYMAAENSLAAYAQSGGGDISEILQGVNYLTANDRVVLFFDGVSLPAIYVIDKHTKASTLSELTPVYQYETDVNSSAGTTLRAVLDYVKLYYPAQEYGIVFWSHASGWIPSTYDGDYASEQADGRRSVRRSFGVDNNRNSSSSEPGSQMNIEELRAALDDFPTCEFIMFDACFMQCIEVAYELRNCTRYLIGSSAEIPAPGAPYNLMMKYLFMDPVDVNGIIDSYYGYYQTSFYGSVLSAIDCGKMEMFAQRMRPLVQSHRDDLLDAELSGVLNYCNYDLYHSYHSFPDFYDIRGLMRHVLSDGEYALFESALNEIIYYNRCTDSWYSAVPIRGEVLPINREQFSGISMFVPMEKYEYFQERFYDAYFQTSWAQAVWN